MAVTERSLDYLSLLGRPPLERYAGETVEGHRQAVQAWCRHLASSGLGRLGLPPEQGGDPMELLRLVRCLAQFDFSLMVRFGVHVGLVQGTIARLGTERHLAWLESTCTLEQVGCFAMTETDHGSNVKGLETRAVYLPGQQVFELHTPHRGAWKDYIGSAMSGRFAIVFAQLETAGEEHGVHALLVPLRDPEGRLLAGIQAEDCGPKMGLNGVDTGRLAFERVQVPRENLLDRFGSVSPEGRYSSPIANPTKRFFTMLSNLVGGRMTLAAASVEASRAGLTVALRHARKRRQFGPAGQSEMPLIDYQMHQKRLLPRLALTEAVESGVQHLIELYGAGHDAELETFAAALKAYATWNAGHTLRLCRECCGAWGYLSENRLGALLADTAIFTTFEGDNTVLSFLVARNLLKRLKGWKGALALLKLPVNPVQAARHDVEHLSSRAFHLEALRFRERRLTASLARRLRQRLARKMDPFLALGDCQEHAVRLCTAHAERVLVEKLDPEDPLGMLFGVGCLEADAAWFLEQGYFRPRKSRAIRALHLHLCARLKDEALERIERVAPPAHLLP